MCFHDACFIAKSMEWDNMSSLTASYLLTTKVNVFLGMELKFGINSLQAE